jgi:hypothetical protein
MAKQKQAKQEPKKQEPRRRPRIKGRIKKRNPRAESDAWLAQVREMGDKIQERENQEFAMLLKQGVPRHIAKNVAKARVKRF